MGYSPNIYNMLQSGIMRSALGEFSNIATNPGLYANSARSEEPTNQDLNDNFGDAIVCGSEDSQMSRLMVSKDTVEVPEDIERCK